MRWFSKLALYSLCLMLAFGTLGCFSSSSSSSSEDENGSEGAEAPERTMSGNWNGTFATGDAFTLDLNQSGDTFTGTYTQAANSGNVTGSVSDNSVSMTVTVTAGAVGAVGEFSGTVNDERTAMSGSFTVVAGGGGSSTWSASR